MAQQFSSDLSGGAALGSLSLPTLAMSMFLPQNGATPPSGAFLDSMSAAEHLGPHAHHHYLNALHQQQFLFNSSLKLGIAGDHHTASAFRKVK